MPAGDQLSYRGSRNEQPLAHVGNRGQYAIVDQAAYRADRGAEHVSRLGDVVDKRLGIGETRKIGLERLLDTGRHGSLYRIVQAHGFGGRSSNW